jgi:hypothetical protein
MDLSTIYKGTKLYNIATPFGQKDGAAPVRPEGFSGVSILYEYEDAPALPGDMATFVSRVIEGGMKLEPAKVLTANLCHADISLQKLSEEMGTKTLVIFGTEWMGSLHNAHLRKNQIVKLFGMKVLVTDTLDVINTNDAAKKAFWGELKKLFV